MDNGSLGGAPAATGTGGSSGLFTITGGSAPVQIVTHGTVTVSDPEHCPAEPPLDPSPCTATEGQACGYWWDDPSNAGYFIYAEFGCFYDNQAALVWGSITSTNGALCPRGMIADGSDCWGKVGLQCPKPLMETCTCPTGTTTPSWECATPALPGDGLGTGPSVDPSKPLTQLTVAERDTWCRWYLTWALPPGAPDPLDAQVGANGYLTNMSLSIAYKFYDDVCLPGTSIAQCAENLALTSCELPVSMLTDCVTTVISANVPSPHGCGRYMATPGCAGTVVASKASGCTIRVR
jgi:hypothetical protein